MTRGDTTALLFLYHLCKFWTKTSTVTATQHLLQQNLVHALGRLLRAQIIFFRDLWLMWEVDEGRANLGAVLRGVNHLCKIQSHKVTVAQPSGNSALRCNESCSEAVPPIRCHSPPHFVTHRPLRFERYLAVPNHIIQPYRIVLRFSP